MDNQLLSFTMNKNESVRGALRLREAPSQRIAPTALKAWRIAASIVNGILWLLVITLGILTYIYGFSKWYVTIATILVLVLLCLFVLIIPRIRYQRWRYEIFDKEIYIQHGLIIVTRTIVPMTRVQHVDTTQGPILKKFNLAGVQISTAATLHTIPALQEKDAIQLRDRISELARVAIDDV